MNCYNCGIKLSTKTNHVEHIPPKNIFNTLPEKYKQQLVTVPACFNCNNEFSKIDQEIRDAIGILNDDSDLLNEITRKSVKSILRRNDWNKRVTPIAGSNLLDISFNYNNFRKLHIKNFKGLIYHQFKKPLSDIYNIELVAEGDEGNHKHQELRRFILSFFEDDIDYQYIGHEDVFKYKLKKIYVRDDQFIKTGDTSEEIGFVCLLIYYNKLFPTIIATKLK